MFCDRCGAQAQEGQQFCGSCGKPLGLAIVPPARGNRVGRHIHILGILWLAASALNLVAAAALFIIGNTIFGHLVRFQERLPVQSFLQGLFSVLGVLVLIKALLGFTAGWGLLQREPWARTLTLVLGFLSLLNIPLGTALGIYTIWVLLAPQADEEYRQLARAA
jgi:hypothetical protein